MDEKMEKKEESDFDWSPQKSETKSPVKADADDLEEDSRLTPMKENSVFEVKSDVATTPPKLNKKKSSNMSLELKKEKSVKE
jgi:hypothetical protein